MKNRKTMIVILVVAIGTFMSSLDSSVVNLITPIIKNDFGVSLSVIEWIITAYLLVVSSLMLTFGRVSDMYGHKKVYLTGFVIFTAGSMLCGLSGNIVMLILCRIIQATGAGMLYATGPAIITNAVPADNRGKAFSVSAVAVAAGLCAGPVIGGTLAVITGWQSIFFINVPIGILGTVLVIRYIPEDEHKEAKPFDIAGSVLICAVLVLILLPISLSGDHLISMKVLTAMLAAGAVLFFFFLFYEQKCSEPMLQLGLFRNRIFSAGNIAALFIYMAQFMMAFLAPFYLENFRKFSALKAGLLYLPMSLATILIAPVSGVIADKFDSRYISSAGTAVMAAGLWMMSYLNAASSVVYIGISIVITGLGFGMFQTPNNSAVMGNAPEEYRGVASGTLATMRNVGMVLGVALSGAMFSICQSRAALKLAAENIPVIQQKNGAFSYGMHITLTAAVAAVVIAMVASLAKGKEQKTTL